MMSFNPYQLSRVLGGALLERNWRIAVAESCTGGGLAYHLTSVAGASRWFERGFVTYTAESKMESLGVPLDVIKQYGEVSPETACAMAEGILRHSAADISFSITGIAGPTGGTAEKPVGTVCFGLAIRDASFEVQWRKALFDSGRKHVRDSAIGYALSWLLEAVRK